ncbi:hypothetical protein C8R45DRAFT_498639 [Mycena sanguinolenta]|nr:hypothetical protein C8R45DRAFT_498639 [Mycena sanguinolenta]
MLSTLAADRTRIAFLGAQILELEKSLSALRLEQAEVQSRLDSYKYPVLTLPTEIITEIFIRIPPPYPKTAWLAGPQSPTSLTQICREWRQIALSIPSLWRAINLSDNGTPIEQRAHIYDLWLRWSRHSPLSIQFNGADDSDASSKVVPLIASNLARLEHLKLAVFLDDLRTIQDSMPVLRHLDLRLLHYHGFGIPPVLLVELPLLCSVVLNFVPPQNVRFPWAQLTSLAMHEIDPEDAILILAQTSNLIHCELHVRNPVVFFGRVVTVPSLESLVLKAHDRHLVFDSYLTFFITPALCRLMISERLLGNEPIRSLTDFISKSGEKLQDIGITGRRSVPENSYREALQSIPRLSFSKREVDRMISSSRAELEIDSDSDTSQTAETD